MLHHDLAGHLSVLHMKEKGLEGSVAWHSVGKGSLAKDCSWIRTPCIFQYSLWLWLCVNFGLVPLSPWLLLSPLLLIQLWCLTFQRCCRVGGVLGSVTRLMTLSQCDLAHQVSPCVFSSTRPAPPFFCPKVPLDTDCHLQLLQQKPSFFRLYLLSSCCCLKIRGNKSAEEIIKINIVLSTKNSS